MGMDIHLLGVRKNGEVINDNIWDGRCRHWFYELKGEGSDPDYKYLPRIYGVPEWAPKEVKDNAEEKNNGCFGFFWVEAKEYVEWFDKYAPNVDAGWISTYNKWLLDKKGIEPEYLPRALTAEMKEEDTYEFIEYPKDEDWSEVIYDFIKANNAVIDDLTIIVYFDW